MTERRTLLMTLIGSLSLLVGVLSLLGSTAIVSDGLGLTRIGSATSGPSVGTTAAPPHAAAAAARVVAFGAIRFVLSILLVVGAVGTFGVTPAGRRCSIAYATGWIALGAIEPLALHYQFGWQVVVSALYAFLLLGLFSRPAWRAAFASSARPERPRAS